MEELNEWPEFDERTASSLCYTSGTTGNPKGVLYSHVTMIHTTMIHTLAMFHAMLGVFLILPLNISSTDVIMPIWLMLADI